MPIQYPVYRPFMADNEKRYVNDCLDTNWISSRGKYITEFEKQFAAFTGIGYATAVCNGTVALHLALLVLGIGPGHEVIVPTLAYVAVPNMVRASGATPVFADALPHTWQIDPEQAEQKITPRTKALIAVHNYGHPCDMDALRRLCDKHGLFLIEDCAEALGSLYKGKHVSAWGDVSAYSFFGNKTITTGEGGMVVSNSEALITKAFHLKNQGVTSKVYWHDMPAYNYRMTNIAAAIGLAQLENAGAVIARKREIAMLYRELFNGSAVTFHGEDENVFNSYWMCSILLPDGVPRDAFAAQLLDAGIETRPLFYPAHTLPFFECNDVDYPVACDLSRRGLNLPSYPGLSNDDVRFIAAKVLELLK